MTNESQENNACVVLGAHSMLAHLLLSSEMCEWVHTCTYMTVSSMILS